MANIGSTFGPKGPLSDKKPFTLAGGDLPAPTDDEDQRYAGRHIRAGKTRKRHTSRPGRSHRPPGL